MTLDHRPRSLQRVGIDAESQLHGDVDGKAHEIAAEVHGLHPLRRPLPAPLQASDRHRKRREEGLEPGPVQSVHHDPALPAPVLSLGRKHAPEAHLGGDGLEGGGAPESLGTLNQDAPNG